MKKSILTLLTILIAIQSFSQDLVKIAKEITDEGKALYMSEKASWHGTDIFLEKFPNQLERVGGYLSYTDKYTPTCIFYSNDKNPIVLGTIMFDTTFNLQNVKIDRQERKLNSIENELYIIRTNAAAAIEKDTLFKYYKNTSLNLIPFIYKGQKKLYVLTGPKTNGVIIFGNDYELIFNDKNKVKSVKRIHQNIIVNEYEPAANDSIVGGIHNHSPLTGDFMTPTDICTLMLYQEFTGWKQYTVVSEKYMSFWDCRNNHLMIIPTSAFDKMEKTSDQK